LNSSVAKDIGLPQDVINVEGGAIAHGHPIGASGAVLTTRLLHSMQRDGMKRGIVTLCIGGGQGIGTRARNASVISPSLRDDGDNSKSPLFR
jgi:acetyl-CoA C-acetyltransferase